MSIPTAEEFIKTLPKSPGAAFSFGGIDPAYEGGNPKILFDGETAVSVKTYPFLSSYTPTVGDRVLLARVSGSYVVLGKIN